MERLTALIPCKNERRNIRPCIESVRPIADEILVADSGSTDGTPEIAEEIGGCRVIRGTWTGYAHFKNWAVSHATHPWVLLVDADERVSPELAEEIRLVLSRPPDGVDAFEIDFVTYFMGRRLRFSNWNRASIRLVRRELCRFDPKPVHEKIAIDAGQVKRLRGKLLHYSIWSCDQYLAKYGYYTKLAAEDMWSRGRRATFTTLLLRPFFRFVFLYLVRGGFLDGLPGLQVCMLMSFFNTLIKQVRLWEHHSALKQPDPERASAPEHVLPISFREPVSSDASVCPPEVAVWRYRVLVDHLDGPDKRCAELFEEPAKTV